MSAILRFWAYGLMLSPVTLGQAGVREQDRRAEAGKVVRRSTAGSNVFDRATCTQGAEARRSWGGNVWSAIM